MDTPSVARIVHFVADESKCRAAIVTAVHGEGLVSLAVFDIDGTWFPHGVRFDNEDHGLGTCHWPERTGGLVDSAKLALIGEEMIVPLKGRS